jgi:hypothetical protein
MLTGACSREHLGPTPSVDAGTPSPVTDAGMPLPTVDGRVLPTPPPPFATALDFRNDTDAPVFVHKGCSGVDFGVSSGAGDFRDRLGPTYHCGCYCDESSCTSPPLCGACPESEGVRLPGGETLTMNWDGLQLTDEEKARPGGGASFTCLRSHALPAGAYRVSIRVFDDAASAAGNVGGRIVTRDFSLPASGGVVDVPLAVNAVDTCDATPSASAPACTGLEAHDVPCSLAEPLAFAWEGGLSFYGEASQLTPPATYGRRRTYYMGTMPDLTCATAIPRCTRDSRVVTTSDIARAINEPTVLAAYATTTPVYGYDYRANDGQILILRRPDGTSLGIGSTCNGCSPTAVANPLTPALSAVGAVLGAFDRQMLNTTGCVALRTPGNYY